MLIGKIVKKKKKIERYISNSLADSGDARRVIFNELKFARCSNAVCSNFLFPACTSLPMRSRLNQRHEKWWRAGEKGSARGNPEPRASLFPRDKRY